MIRLLSSVCKEFVLAMAILVGFLCLSGVRNLELGQVKKYYFAADFFVVTGIFLYPFVKMYSFFVVLSYKRILNLKTQGL